MSNHVLYTANKIAVTLFGTKDTSSWPPLLLQHRSRIKAPCGSSSHPSRCVHRDTLFGALFHFPPFALFLLARCPRTVLPGDFSDTSFGFLCFFGL